MKKRLKCIACGGFIVISLANPTYTFLHEHCFDCREKIKEQPDVLGSSRSPGGRNIYLVGLASTASAITDTYSQM